MIHWLDGLILAAFIVYAIAAGLRNRARASRNLAEYFLAGRSLKGWQAGVSMAATQFAADTPLLVTGLIATAGIFSLWQLWIYGLSFLLMGFLLAGPWRRAAVLTDAELTEIRYGGGKATFLRAAKAVYFGTIFNCTVLAMVLLAATRIAEPFLLWNEWLPPAVFDACLSFVRWLGVPFTVHTDDAALLWVLSTNNLISILCIVIVTTLYSATGGLRSVVSTDVLQFSIMLLGTLLYTGFVVQACGGLTGLSAQIQDLYAQGAPNGITASEMLAFTPSEAHDVGLGLLAVFGLQWLIQMNADGTGYLAQRSMACRSDADARFAAVLFTYLQILLRSLLWLPLALGLVVLYPLVSASTPEQYTALREATFVLGMRDLLPIGVKGLLLTAMLAALASTVDTHLNWGAGYWTHDLYERVYCEKLRKRSADPRQLVWVARVSNVGILLIALVIMAHLNSIQSAWQGSLLIGAAMGIPLLLRWFWWRMNAWGEIAAIGVATLCAPFFLDLETSGPQNLLAMAALSLAATLAAVVLKGPEEEAVLRAFYQRVRPSGFWGPVAGDRSEARALQKRFCKKLGQAALCALSCFGLLVGVGTWLVDGTPPAWFPHARLWPPFCIALALAVLPLWWRPLRADKT